MTETTDTLIVLVRDAAWQSTLVLCIGLIIARYVVRQPARVHAVLALAFLATIAAPIATQMVRRQGWGLLAPVANTATQTSPAVDRGAAAPLERPEVANAPALSRDQTDWRQTPTERASLSPTTVIPTSNTSASLPALMADISPAPGTTSYWQTALTLGIDFIVLAWLLTTALAIFRLLGGIRAGRRLVAAASPCSEPTVLAALSAARDRLGLGALRITALETSDVHCPLIWCWGRQPRVLLPSEAVREWTSAQWTPVLCHELAHWKRRDHWSALAAELVCCLLPWQLLAWSAKRRLEHASEQACDDWTIAVGHSATDYAETLLSLVAQADPPLALAALRRRSGLSGRIRHILTQAVPRPRLGWLWGAAVFALTASGVGAAALCQRGAAQAEPSAAAVEVKPGDSEAAKESTPSVADKKPLPTKPAAPKAASPSGEITGTFVPGAMPANGQMAGGRAPSAAQAKKRQRYTAMGKILTPDGQPVAGALIVWQGFRRSEALKDQTLASAEEFARTTTGADGGFLCAAQIAPGDAMYTTVAIQAAGYGLKAFNPDVTKIHLPAEVRLEHNEPIDGTIFTPNGEPVANARVEIENLGRNAPKDSPPGGQIGTPWYLNPVKSAAAPSLWPAAATTDAQGRFHFDNVLPRGGAARLAVFADNFAPTRLTVVHADAPRYEEPVRESTFTLVLENPYLVESIYTDEKTGAPIPGVRVEVLPYNNRRGFSTSEYIAATSDQAGRALVRFGTADGYMVKVLPPLGYPGISTSFSLSDIERQAAGTRKIKYPVKLRAGQVLRGRVVAKDTGAPVVGAQVKYVLGRGRKLGINADFQPVATAADGSFEVTGADGKGHLQVEAPGQGFYRLTVDKDRAPAYSDAIYPHGFIDVNVPADGQKEPFTIALERGPEFVVQALSPEGKPVKQLIAAYTGQTTDGYIQGEECAGGLVRIDAVDPGRPLRLFLYSEDTNSGLVADLTAPADGKPIELRLQPCATIRGRYVYEGGAPASELTNFSHFDPNPERGERGQNAQFSLPFYENFARHQNPKRVTDADGNFELDGLVPGTHLYLQLNYKFPDGKNYYEIGALAPGEVKDVGEMVVRPR